MSSFKSEVKVYVAGITVGKPLMSWGKRNTNVSITNVKVKVDTKQAAMLYELAVWGDKAHNEAGELMLDVMTMDKIRVIAVGEPTDQSYEGRIQHRISCRELWVEDLKTGQFVAVLLPKPEQEADTREYTPIEVPETVL